MVVNGLIDDISNELWFEVETGKRAVVGFKDHRFDRMLHAKGQVKQMGAGMILGREIMECSGRFDGLGFAHCESKEGRKEGNETTKGKKVKVGVEEEKGEGGCSDF